ncbi:hypothetical protein B0H14DRAFT_2955633 [Mycena olivaceomarginata]|nr:hypothetical protein B0H14DRAFT_2955633 [Mycena olivaceomarginata]
MEGHSGWVHSVAFSPDGARIVSGLDVTVRISRLSDWICTMDGWVVLHGHPQFRLFWYPPELRDTVLVPPCLCRISEIGQTRLKFRTRFLGTNWQQVHHSPHFSFDAPASGNPASVSAFSERHWTIVDPKNATEQAVQDDLALRRLMLDEKAQLIEMLRLDVLTKDKFKAQLAQIEARYEATTRPSPAKRARLASSSDVGSSREVGNISLF